MSVQTEITELLEEAGASPVWVEQWWGDLHPRLTFFSPRDALERLPGVADDTVVQLARADARALKTAAAGPWGAPAAEIPRTHDTGGHTRCSEA